MSSDTIQHLLAELAAPSSSAPVLHQMAGEDSVVNINRITEKAGMLYEKVRYLVDYKEERHIRRSAIERIIKRKLLFEGGEGIGISLIQELVAGGYLPNNSVAESSATLVEAILTKFRSLYAAFPEDLKKNSRARVIIISLAASEIDAYFFPNKTNDLVVDAFYATVRGSVKPNTEIGKEELDMQVYLACYRSLLNVDEEMLLYRLWLKYNPTWLSDLSVEEIETIATHSYGIFKAIRLSLDHPLSFRLLSKIRNYSIYFSVIKEVVEKYGSESGHVLDDEAQLQQFTKEFLETNYRKEYFKVRGSAIRAIFYIFLTKIVLAMALELPYEIFIAKSLEYVPLVTNIVLHPFLLMCMTLSVRPLGAANTEKIISGVKGIVKGEEIRGIKVVSKNSISVFNFLFYILYACMFAIVFGIIISLLVMIHFNIVSIILFVSFLTLVSYFGLRIRQGAQKWKVSSGEEGVLSMLFNISTLPIVRMGRWLSRKFSSVNLFVFILDFIIETPFKLVLNVSDSFISFLKEKRDDVY